MEIKNLIERLDDWDGVDAIYNGRYVEVKYHGVSRLLEEAAAALEQLQAENEKFMRERDAAVKDLRECSIENRMECQYCLYRTARSFCWDCTDGFNWKWRGRKEE